MKKWGIALALVAICFFGGYIRNYNLLTWPREGATFDEYAWPWIGMSLLDTGVPMSWSRHAPYKLQTNFVNAKGAQFVLSTPYLEHPPVFGFVAGSFAKLMGAESFDTMTLAHVRPFALILGVLSILMVYLLASSVFGPIVGLLSSLIYAIIPTVSVGSRILENENFFIPLFLLLLWTTNRYMREVENAQETGNMKQALVTGQITKSMGRHEEEGTARLLTPERSDGRQGNTKQISHLPVYQLLHTVYFVLILLLSFVLPLAKIPWIAAPIASIGVFLYAKRYREAISIFAICFLSILSYIAWGYRWDWGVFTGLMKLQTARYDMSFDGFLSLVTNPLVTDRIYTDGWILFGWIAMAIMLVKEKANRNVVTFGFLAYLGIYLFAIPNEAGHGWYRYPFYPFLAIASAWSLNEYFFSQPIFAFLFGTIVGLPMIQHLIVPKIGFSYPLYRGYLLLVASPLVTLITDKPWMKRFVMILSLVIFALIVFLSYKAGLRYNEQ
jgi:hypothetical protein